MGQREGRIQSAERAMPTFSFRERLRTFFQPDSGGLQAQSRKEGRNGCQAAAGASEPGAVQETSERVGYALSSCAIAQVNRFRSDSFPCNFSRSNSASEKTASAFCCSGGRRNPQEDRK